MTQPKANTVANGPIDPLIRSAYSGGHVNGRRRRARLISRRNEAMIGLRIGAYEVVAKVGEGGMGEVYRARDPRLKRDVAIKVLARAGADPARQRRFTDEAQAASALNHPNIVTVYDVGVHDTTPYIVSEIVEGTSLRVILGRAPLPVREALALAVQMAEGLAAAHRAGIVHRDFKPENVMVTPEGRVKILDFGLALVGPAQDAGSDATLTATGMIVGTVPYMSPEQARGATVDYRTDQFSLGLTLYEMLTGRRAFKADTAAQTLTRILEDDPEPMAVVSPRVPPPLRWTIERCLAKDARSRFESTGDLARELSTLRDRLPELTAAAGTPGMPGEIDEPRRGLRRAILGAALMAALAVAGVLGALSRGDHDAGLDRYVYTPFATDAGYQASPAWSSDGKTLAYVADVDGVLQVFQKSVGSPTRTQVTHGNFDCREPFWSFDGTRLYYTSRARDRDGLWSISAVGGLPEIVMENVAAASLSPDGKTLALFRNAEQGDAMAVKLWLSSPPGAAPQPYARAWVGNDRRTYQATSHFSPDGSRLGVWLVSDRRSEFWVLPMADAAPYAVSLPVADLAPFPVPFGWLPDGRHVVAALARPRPGVHLWLVDTRTSDARLLTASNGIENQPAVSPDGAKLALTDQQADYDLYRFSLDQPSPSIVLATSRNEMDPASSRSGGEMAFTTDRAGHEEIWLRSQTGDIERPVVTPSDFGSSPTTLLSSPALSPNGQQVAYNRVGSEGDRIWISPVAGGPPVQLAPGTSPQDWPTWSPDGAWIAFGQGNPDLLVKMRVGARTPPETVASDIVPVTGAPEWSPDGSWLAYNSLRGLALVSPDGKSTRVLHERAWMAVTWSPDSQRVFGIRQSDDLTHMTFTSVDVRSGAERVLNGDFMSLPVSEQPVRGLTRISPTTFLAAIVKVRSDIWLLDGFQPSATLWDRLVARIH
jgi:eukaryotic-like serine/threonine-protein kinase